jgi:hypothetical protein
VVTLPHGGGAGLTPRLPSWAVAVLLITAGVALYWPVFHLVPFEEDNVYALAWAASTPAARVLAVDPFYYPEWRPLAYATVWIEQRLGVPIAVHFAINLGLWIACAWLAYRIARQLADSAIAGGLAAALVLSDPRATWTLVAIIERQTSLACVFGLSAILLTLPLERRLTGIRQAGLTALLTASILSKEYGAAFALTLAGYGVIRRRGDLLKPALAAAAGYVAIRLLVVGAIVQPYCEEMYLFGTARDVCIEVTQPASFPQLAYNAAATLVNLPLLGLLSGTGAPIFAESRLVTGVVLTALALVAVAKGPRTAWMLALTVAANALLSVMIYRDRNQLVGACAMAILAGLGWPIVMRMWPNRLARVAMAAALITLIAVQAVLSRALVVERAALAGQIDPCGLEIMERDFVPAYAARLKSAYRTNQAGCGH